MSIGRINNQGLETQSLTSKQDQNEKNNDKYMQYPIRGLAYTNEVGVALQPIIKSGPALAFWVPALAYFGFDIHDKYKQGVDGQDDPSSKTAGRRALLHSVTSVVAPTLAIHFAQEGAIKLGGASLVKNLHKKISEDKIGFISSKSKNIIGQKLFKLFGNKDQITVAKESNKFFKFINKIPIIGSDPVSEVENLQKAGINTKGGKAMAMALKTLAGFGVLALVAKPIDKLYEPFEDKFVNKILGLNETKEKESETTIKYNV